MAELPSWKAMRRDLADLDGDTMPLREKLSTWASYYWWPTRRWWTNVAMWWGYTVRGWPKRPPFEEDPIAQHFGFIEGVPACTDGPVCAAHGWRLSPLVEGDPYAHCAVYLEHGACSCSTGYPGSCTATPLD